MAWRDDIVTALRDLGGVAQLNDIYAQLDRSLPRERKTATWEASVRRTIEQHSSDTESYAGRNPDLFYSVDGIGRGRWGLRESAPTTPKAVDVAGPPETTGNPQPGRVEVIVSRIVRETQLARGLKALHKYECQICGASIQLQNGGRYAEAHHIKPLGGAHGGPDLTANILVLCPNHHAMCDFGVIPLNLKELRQLPAHDIGREFIEYHNTKIYRNVIS